MCVLHVCVHMGMCVFHVCVHMGMCDACVHMGMCAHVRDMCVIHTHVMHIYNWMQVCRFVDSSPSLLQME